MPTVLLHRSLRVMAGYGGFGGLLPLIAAYCRLWRLAAAYCGRRSSRDFHPFLPSDEQGGVIVMCTITLTAVTAVLILLLLLRHHRQLDDYDDLDDDD